MLAVAAQYRVDKVRAPLGGGPQQPRQRGQPRASSRTRPADDGEATGHSDRRPQVEVAVGQCLGQSLCVVGSLDLRAQPVELLPARVGYDHLAGGEKAHRGGREIATGSAHVETAVRLLGTAVAGDGATRRGERMETAQQTAELGQHRRVVAASVGVGGTPALDRLGDDHRAGLEHRHRVVHRQSLGRELCSARNLRISASPWTRSSRSAAEEKTRAIQDGPSERRTYSVDG